MMLTRNLIGCISFCILLIFSVSAQTTPSDVRDLVGVRASNGERELKNRGYRLERVSRSNNETWSYWWSSRNNICIAVVTYNGRYDSIESSPASDCGRGGYYDDDRNDYRGVTPPNWAQGTFFGIAPTGERIRLTINRNGNVTADIDGRMLYGTYTRGNYLNIDGATSRVSRQGNGIVTIREDNGLRIAYSRNGGYSNDDDDWDDDYGNGQTVTPPNWAQGTFYGYGPNGGRIVLNINRNGRVSADIDGRMLYGTYTRGNYLNIDGATSRVSRQGNGIVTTRQDNGLVISYTRSGGYSNDRNDRFVDVSDLIGMRSSSGDTQLRNRGFRLVDSSRGRISYAWWYRRQSDQCVEVTVSDGRYSDIRPGQHRNCR